MLYCSITAPSQNPSDYVHPISRGGVIRFRVDITVNGVRSRNSYASRVEAEAAAQQVLAANQSGSVAPHAIYIHQSTLRDPIWIRLAEQLAQIAEDSSLTLDEVRARMVDALSYNDPTTTPMDMERAITLYLSNKQNANRAKGYVSVQGYIFRNFARIYRITAVDQCDNLDSLKGFVYDPECAPSTLRNRYDRLCNFFEFLVQHRWLKSNPIYSLDRPKVKWDKPIAYLRHNQIAQLFSMALTYPVGRRRKNGGLLGYLGLIFFSGLRPTEAQYVIDHSDTCIVRKKRIITDFPTKTGGPRDVTILPCLEAIFNYLEKQGIGYGCYSRKAFAQLRIKAKVNEEWCNDCARHSYASHLYALKGDSALLTREMGNSLNILESHYVCKRVLKTEAKHYFGQNGVNPLPWLRD